MIVSAAAILACFLASCGLIMGSDSFGAKKSSGSHQSLAVDKTQYFVTGSLSASVGVRQDFFKGPHGFCADWTQRTESQMYTPAKVTNPTPTKKNNFMVVGFRLLETRLSATDKLVLAYLGRRQGKNEYAWPKQSRMCADLAISPKTASRAINRLEAASLLIVTRASGNGRRNRYALTAEAKRLVSSRADCYIRIADELAALPGINPTAKLLFGLLTFQAQGQEYACRPVAELAATLGSSRPTILAARAELEAAGLVQVLKGHGGLRQRNYYAIRRADLSAYNSGAAPNLAQRNDTQLAQRNDGQLTGPTSYPKRNSQDQQAIASDSEITPTAQRGQARFPVEVMALVDRHIELSPAARHKVAGDPTARTFLARKCARLVDEIGPNAVGQLIAEFSSRGTRGDGWGLVLKGQRWIESKQRERAYASNQASDAKCKKRTIAEAARLRAEAAMAEAKEEREKWRKIRRERAKKRVRVNQAPTTPQPGTPEFEAYIAAQTAALQAG